MSMLVLSRKKDERIVIVTPEGRRIVVTMVRTVGCAPRIGIEADAEVTIDRWEVAERKAATDATDATAA